MRNRISELLENPLVKEILSFFHQNQASIDSVGGISAWVQSDRDNVRSALDELVGIGVLVKDSTGATDGYAYTRDEGIMEVVTDLMCYEG